MKKIKFTPYAPIILKHGYMKFMGLTIKQALILEIICKFQYKRKFPFTIKSVSEATGISRDTIITAMHIFHSRGLIEWENNSYHLTQELVDIDESLKENIKIHRYSKIDLAEFKKSELGLYEYCLFKSIQNLDGKYGKMRGGYDGMQKHLGISRRYLFRLKRKLIEKGLVTNVTFKELEPVLTWENIDNIPDHY
jgi:DNA-binding MarR family transcriptional regulator